MLSLIDPETGTPGPALPGIAITWKCHVCGEERPDEMISVLTTDLSAEYGFTPGSHVLIQNVRYCIDRVECIEGAKTKRLVSSKLFGGAPKSAGEAPGLPNP